MLLISLHLSGSLLGRITKRIMKIVEYVLLNQKAHKFMHTKNFAYYYLNLPSMDILLCLTVSQESSLQT